MLKHLKRRPSPSLVISCLALLVALGGTSYATVVNVPKKSVGTAHLKRGAVGTAQLKRNAVKARQLAPNAVRSAHVLNGSLLATDFKPGQLPKGDKGDKGDKGEKGEIGLSGWELVQASSPLDSSSPKSVTANCPSGKRPLGGGAGMSNLVKGVSFVLSRPVQSPGGWRAAAWEDTATALNWQMFVWVICANVDS